MKIITRIIKTTFCIGLMVIMLVVVVIIHARKKAQNYIEPLEDIVEYKSYYIAPYGTDSGGVSLMFCFLPKGEDNHYATFYVETSVLGEIKSFSGPFMNDRVIHPAEVRPFLMAELEKKKWVDGVTP